MATPRFKFEDREYDFDQKMTIEEAILLHEKAGVGLAGFARELMLGNPYVIATVVLICKKRAGEAVRWQDLMTADITSFELVDNGAGDAVEGTAGDGEAESDPSRATGKTRPKGTTAT